MTRKIPNARRATALAVFASLLFALQVGAWFPPPSASAEEVPSTIPGRRPLPGDPNTPDEGGRSGSLTRYSDPKSSTWVMVLIKGVFHITFLAR